MFFTTQCHGQLLISSGSTGDIKIVSCRHYYLQSLVCVHSHGYVVYRIHIACVSVQYWGDNLRARVNIFTSRRQYKRESEHPPPY